jgi:hypothetical protein
MKGRPVHRFVIPASVFPCLRRTPATFFFRSAVVRWLLWMALMLGPIPHTQGAVPVDPDGKRLSPAEQRRIARTEAEQSERDRLRVAKERYAKRQAYHQELVAGMQSELARRRQSMGLSPNIDSPAVLVGEAAFDPQPEAAASALTKAAFFWLVILCGFAGLSLYYRRRKRGGLADDPAGSWGA